MWLKQILTDIDFGSLVLKSRAVKTCLNEGNEEVDIKDLDIVIMLVTTVGKYFANLLPTVSWKSDGLLTKIEVLENGRKTKIFGIF